MNEDWEEAADEVILMTDLMMNRICKSVEVLRPAMLLVAIPLCSKKILM
jgi:hypothetical protein